MEDVIDGQEIVTTEDILPPKVYAAAIARYVKRWYPDRYEEIREKLDYELAKPESYSGGVVAGATAVFNSLIHEHPKSFDKMGVLQELTALLPEGISEPGLWIDLEKRVVKVCHAIRRAISASQQAARRSSGKQAIQRLIDDYFKINKESSSVFDIQLLLERIQRDTKLLGEDGEILDGSVNRMLSHLTKTRGANQQHFRGETWARWKVVLGEIRKNPLATFVKVADEGPLVDGRESEGLRCDVETPTAQGPGSEENGGDPAASAPALPATGGA